MTVNLFQLLGVALLAIGIYVQVESTFDMLRLSSVLTSPAIAMIILGGMLFILGFCGCLGALLEIFYLLVVVSNHKSINSVSSLYLAGSPVLCTAHSHSDWRSCSCGVCFSSARFC